MNKTLLLIALTIGLRAFGQSPESHTQKAFTDSTGTLYWNKHTPFYLRIASSPTDTGMILQSKKQKKWVNPGYFDEEGVNTISTRFAVDPQTKKPLNPPVEVEWNIVADGMSPKTQVSFSGASQYANSQTLYFGPGLKADVKANDALSGVEKTFVSENTVDYRPYSQTLIFDKEGTIQLAVYSVDHVGNVEKPILKNFTIDLTAPQSQYAIEGPLIENIVNVETKIKLSSQDNLSGVRKIEFQIDDRARQAYTSAQLPTNTLPDGEHTVRFFATDNVGNVEKTAEYTFYLDKLPPIITSDVLGDRFIVNDQIYFSGRTKLKLTSVDNKSGIKDIMYSVDTETFSSYSQPFYLPSKPGMHIVRFFAVDKMENMSTGDRFSHDRYEEYRHNVNKIYVDLTGPTLQYQIIGPKITVGDTTFLSKDSRIRLAATDNESGLQYISYSINGNQAEEKYTQPFGLVKDGLNGIEIFGYDNVNNRNRDDFKVIIDNTPPQIFFVFSIVPLATKEGLPLLSRQAKLYLAATDARVGTKRIEFSVNAQPFQPYTTAIGGFVPNTLNTVRVKAIDMLLNEQIDEVKFWIEK